MAIQYGADTPDLIVGGTENDTLYGWAETDVGGLQGPADDHDTIEGGAGDDLIRGGAGNDSLTGGDGADTLDGGAGDDVFVIDGQDVVTGGDGYDTVRILSNLSIQRLVFDAASSVEVLDASRAYVDGTAGDDIFDISRLTKAEFHSYINLFAGNDTYRGGDDNNQVDGGAGDDLLIGGARYDGLWGGVGDDTLVGGAGGDDFEGGDGDDLYVGGEGDDLFWVDDDAGLDTFRGGEGVDTIISIGDTIYNVLRLPASASVERIDGYLRGTVGNDVFDLSGVKELSWSTRIDLGGGDDVYRGSQANDSVAGGDGDDTLDGGVGEDQLTGGAGDDVYMFDHAGDVAIEVARGGTDIVIASVDAVLGDNVEQLQLVGSSALNGTGNALANRIVGNAAANRIDGGGGADTMIGGAGDDIYVVDHRGDRAVESADGGVDLVVSTIDWTLDSGVERLTLVGSAAIDGRGNALANIITGNAAANRIDGGAGVDRMVGGAGDDVYVVDEAGDRTIERAGEGRDTVRASIGITLQNAIEDLVLTGASNIDGSGNALANRLTGNAGANRLAGGEGDDTLDGGAGGDRLVGGAGNDVYMVDDSGDVVAEAVDGGIDVVYASLSHTLAGSVENLTLAGAADIDGRGNSLANRLVGNAGANTLDGAGGADTMIGGAGDDVYVVDDAGDRVTEGSYGGVDTVRARIDYALGLHVENLVLEGQAAINGAGNGFSNRLTGNNAANVLSGGIGADTLSGGGGADRFLFDTAPNAADGDEITDFVSGTDVILLSASSFAGLALGRLDPSAFVFGASAQDADDRIIYNEATGALLFDRDGSASAYRAVEFATLTNLADVSIADILVV